MAAKRRKGTGIARSGWAEEAIPVIYPDTILHLTVILKKNYLFL
jgi:hypothetical protein